MTIALALVLTVAPAFALASCSQNIAGMHSEMVGMVMPPAGLSFSEIPSVTCCVFAPAEITSSWITQADASALAINIGVALPEYLPQDQEPVLSPAFLAETPPTQAFP